MKKFLSVVTLSLAISMPVFAYTSEQLAEQLRWFLAEHEVSQAEEEALFARLFDGLNLGLEQSESVPTPTQTNTSARVTRQADTSLSNLFDVYVPAGYEPVNYKGKASIRDVWSATANDDVRGNSVGVHGDLIELYVDVEFSDGRTLEPDNGYIVVADIGGEVRTLSYYKLQQAWYLSRQRSLSADGDLEILVLCQSCNGTAFGKVGPYANWNIVDRQSMDIREISYRGYRPDYTRNDGRYYLDESQSFALKYLNVWSEEDRITFQIEIYNDSIRDGRLNKSDIDVELISREFPGSRLSYNISRGALECENGSSSVLDPQERCTMEIYIAVPDQLRGTSAQVIISHTESTNKKNEISRRVSFPQLPIVQEEVEKPKQPSAPEKEGSTQCTYEPYQDSHLQFKVCGNQVSCPWLSTAAYSEVVQNYGSETELCQKYWYYDKQWEAQNP